MARTPKVVEDRREQIIGAAMRVFSQKGFTRATNKDVAREAGITPGLIYYYFESKEALLKAILEERSPLPVVTSLPAEMLALPAEVFLRFLIQRVLGIVESEKFVQLLLVIFSEMTHNVNLSEIVLGLVRHILAFVDSYFKSKMEIGELRQADVALTVQVFIGGVIGFVLRRQILRDPVALEYSHEQIADAVVETVLKGMLPR